MSEPTSTCSHGWLHEGIACPSCEVLQLRATLRTLEAERDEAKTELLDTIRQLTTTETRVTALEAWMTTHGRHGSLCGVWSSVVKGGIGCTCGLATLLTGGT